MRKRNFFLIVSILIIIHIIFVFFYNRMAYRNLDDFKIENELLSAKNDIKFLITGDSRVQKGVQIDDDQFGSIASENENYIYTYYKLKYLFEQGLKPEYIILQLDLYSFTNYKNQILKPYGYWLKKVNYFEVSKNRYGNEYNYWIHGKLFPHFFNSDNKEETKRFENDAGIFDASLKIEQYFGKGFFVDYTMLTYFEKILQLCEEHNRKVVLLSMPLSKEYLNEFSKKIIDIEEYVSVELTIEKYPCVVYDLAYQTEYIEKAEYFSSTDHLNLSGRNQLSELILKELQGLEE